ncbi:hypothetical protein QYF36_023360 [Acer negundo]|nr:hypothetical protein QYF36_023360 [Acer negundo]
MTASLGSKLFTQANKVGMMNEGYAWIVTEGLSTLMDLIDPKVMDPSMQAYDTVWAVAMAVEKASAGGIANSSFLKPNTSKTSSLGGKFHLFNGQLEPSAFEIFNVIGETERIIGYWTEKKRLFPDLINHNSKEILNELPKKPIWPGNTVEQPRKLRIGVPVREGFKEFIKVEWTNNHSLVVWVLEHRVNTDFRGPRDHQIGTIFWFSFSTLVFAHRERVVNNWSRFVLIIWVFVVLILTQSYTASLTSMLTVQRLKPRFADVKEIQDHDYFVGYQKDSFVKELLTKQLNFDESKLKPYSTEEEFHQALSNGTVAAIFDEIPYIK